MAKLRKFTVDVDVVIGRGDFNLKGLRYVVNGNTLTILEDEPALRDLLGGAYDGVFEDCDTLTLVEEHFEGAQFNPFSDHFDGDVYKCSQA